MGKGGGGSSPPPAPDYAGAAAVTAEGNQDAARVAAKANRVSQYTPYGNLVYSNGIDGDQDKWRADVTLAPEQKALLDAQNRMSQGLADVGEQGVGYVANALDNPFDWNQINSTTPQGQAGNEGWERAYNSILDRANPVWDRDQGKLENQLINQGLQRGSEAWGNAMDDFSRRKNDFVLGAQQQAGAEQNRQFGLDQTARQQNIQEQSFARNEPVNMLNAVRSGSQVTNPSFVNAPQQSQVAGPNMLGAAQAGYDASMAGYNAQQANANNMTNGLFSLGSAAASNPAMWSTMATAFSDIRLKKNIQRIGTHPLGIGIYSFDYVWDEPSVGVMAQELETVMPEAVGTFGGFKTVNYSMIGI